MTMHIVLNGREVTSPAAKFGISVAAVLGAALVTAAVVFILLPLIGVAVTLSMGLVAILLVAVLAGIAVVVLSSFLYASLVGPVELLVEKMRRRKF